MKILLFFIPIFLLYAEAKNRNKEDPFFCPPGCYCNALKTPVPDPMIPFGHLTSLKVNCHPLASPESLDFSTFPENTIHLDLATYGMTRIAKGDFGQATPWLEKLDLRGNQISEIENEAFSGLRYLQILDLSGNNLRSVTNRMFIGLDRLTRLKLNDNRIVKLESEALKPLVSLHKIELGDNQLLCDCNIEWLLDVIEERPTLLGLKTRCALPINLADIPLKRVKKESLLTCDEGNQQNFPSAGITLRPERSFVAFKGDDLRLECQIRISVSNADVDISWNLKGKPISSYSGKISVNEDYTENTFTSTIDIQNIDVMHSGHWTCYNDGIGRKSVDVLVIATTTKLCPSFVSRGVKGVYEWGTALGGHTHRLPCQNPIPGTLGFAYHVCRESGEWAPEVNVSQCGYTSVVTDTLHKFAYMNTSNFDRSSLLESAQQLKNYTGDPSIFRDPMDLQYFAEAIDNYVPYLTTSGVTLAELITNMIANVLDVDFDLMLSAEKELNVVTRFRHILMNVTSVVPRFDYRRGNSLVVSGVPQSKEIVICTWTDTFRCDEEDDTKLNHVLVSVKFDADPHRQPLRTAAFKNSSLFPSPARDIESYVIGIWSDRRLTSVNASVTIAIKQGSGDDVRLEPVSWTGHRWVAGTCGSVTVEENGILQFRCPNLGFYALRRRVVETDSFRVHRTVSHFGSVPIVLTFVVLIAIYGSTSSSSSLSSASTLSKKIKYCLINLWTSLSVLIYFFVGGAHLVEDDLVCGIVGLILHYSTLASLMWFLITVNALYSEVAAYHEVKRPLTDFLPSTVSTTERPQENIVRGKPTILRYNLVGWGVPAIVVGISAGFTRMDYYRGYDYNNVCFLTMTPFLGLLVVPWALITALMIGFSLSIFCLLNSPPSHITEQQRTDKNERGRVGGGLIKAVLVTYALFVIMWILGALSILKSLKVQRVIFSSLYAVVGIVLATFSVVYFVVLRRDFFIGLRGQNNKIEEDDDNDSKAADNDDECSNLVLKQTSSDDHAVSNSSYPVTAAPPPSTTTSTNNYYQRFNQSLNSEYHLSNNNLVRIGGCVAPVNSETEYAIIINGSNRMPKTSSPNLQPPPFAPNLSPYDVKSIVSGSVNDLNDSEDIKIGDPCRMFSLSQAGLPPHYSSLPRASKSQPPRQKRYRHHRSTAAINDEDDEDDVRSRITTYSGKRHHKRPNRRRPRPKKQETGTLDRVPEVLNSSQYSSSELNKRETSV